MRDNLEVGDLVKRIHWQQLGAAGLFGGSPRPASEKKYPAEPMSGIIIDIVGVARSAIAGEPWDYLVLWESGRTSQLSERGIEKIRRSWEQYFRSAWEEEDNGQDPPEHMLANGRDMDAHERLRYGCQCRGCDDYYHRNPRKSASARKRNGDCIPSPDCEYGEANESR